MNNPYYETSSEALNMKRMARKNAIKRRITSLEQNFKPDQLRTNIHPLVEIIKEIYLGIEELKEQVAILQARSK